MAVRDTILKNITKETMNGLDIENLDIMQLVEKMGDLYQKELENLNHVNIILAGKTGVGKSTLINAVFGSSIAATGVGAPVSQEISYYAKEGIPMRLYDTKGLELSSTQQTELKRDISELIEEK